MGTYSRRGETRVIFKCFQRCNKKMVANKSSMQIMQKFLQVDFVNSYRYYLSILVDFFKFYFIFLYRLFIIIIVIIIIIIIYSSFSHALCNYACFIAHALAKNLVVEILTVRNHFHVHFLCDVCLKGLKVDFD